MVEAERKKGGGITREIFLPCMECLEILHEGIMKKRATPE